MKYPSPGDNCVHPDPEIFQAARTQINAERDRNSLERNKALVKFQNDEAARAGNNPLYNQSGPYWQRRLEIQLDFTEQLFRKVAKIWMDVTRRKNNCLTEEDVSFISQELTQMAEQAPKHIAPTLGNYNNPAGAKSLVAKAESRCQQVLSQLRAELKAAVYEDKYPPLSERASESKPERSEWLKPQVWAVGIVVGIVVGIAIEVVKAAYHHTLLQWGAFFSLHSILFVLTFSVAVVLATVGIRRFRALTDLSIGYSYSFIPRNGWMPDMRVQSSPSAPRHVLGNIKVTKKVKLFGYEGETLGGFDNSPMGKIIEPGTITYFRAGICSIADGQPGHPPTLLELQAGKVNAWEAWNYHVASQKLLVRTEGGLEFKASGPGDLLPAWKVRLYQVRKWLDKYLFKPTK